MKYKYESIDNPQNIVNAFAENFSSVYQTSDPIMNESSQPCIPQCVKLTYVSKEDIKMALKKLKDKPTAGVDLIPSFLIRDCSRILVEPLHIVYNLILKTSHFPALWKVSRICPVFKAGDVSLINNYRPISIICNFAKVFEAIVHKFVHNGIKPYLSPHQHGFIEKRSTVTNLALFTQYAAEVLDEKGQVDVVYTDFQKAFDKIDHYVLLSKLDQIGLSESLLTLIKSYIFERTQFVHYGGANSFSFSPSSGVPQGSNLGPLLFLVYVNDIASSIAAPVLLFADDMKIFSSVKSIEDCKHIQDQIEIVAKWCLRNRLTLNVDKCRVMTFTRTTTPFQYPYIIHGQTLKRCECVKDLGITFDSALTFNSHVDNVVLSATRIAGFIIRNTRKFTDLNVLKVLYFSLVRTKLEYGSIIFYPLYKVQIQTLENVQRRFLKVIYFRSRGTYPCRGLDYDILLHMFSFSSLSDRRFIISVSILYKLVNSRIDCAEMLNKISFRVPKTAARHEQTFYLKACKTNVLVKAPLNVMCCNFNMLSSKCDINHMKLKHLLRHTNPLIVK